MSTSQPPVDELLLLLSLARPTDAEASRARELARNLGDWSALWKLAELNATAPLVHRSLQSLGLIEQVSPNVLALFEARSAKVRAANEARLEVAKELFARFAQRRVDVVILKGVLFAEVLYGDAGYKKMNDLDILIRRGDLEAVYNVYEELGLFSAAELVGGNPRKQEKFSHHAPPFFSRDLACMVGTHWGLITPLSPYRLDYDGIWARVEDVGFYGHPAKSLSPTDNLHHLCVHLPYYKCGVRELADIYNLLRHYREAVDVGLLLREVKKAGTEDLVFHALSLSQRLCPVPGFDEVLETLEPRVSWYCRRDTARKVASRSRLLRARSVHLSRIEKAFSDLRATERPAEKWDAYGRMLKGLLLPPTEDVQRMNSLESVGGATFLAARAVSPWRIYRVFKRDLGATIFAAILAKSAVDCVGATVKAPFAAGKPTQDLDAFAGKLGLRREQLEQLKEALE